MTITRTEKSPSYKTTVKRTLVSALRDVFTSQYPEQDFQDLNVTTQFPLSQIDYPAIIIEYNEARNVNAGVGHKEFFPDPDGNLREWRHRRYEGEIEFTIAALSPLDRDILSDALIEILAFGQLNELQDEFFIRVYGAIGVDVGTLGLLMQVSLNTDVLQNGGNTSTIAPWQPEDVLVYTTTYAMDVHGGFYNGIPAAPGLGLIEHAIILPYIGPPVPFDSEGDIPWIYAFDFNDFDSILGVGVIGSMDDHHDVDVFENQIVLGRGVIFTDLHNFTDAGTVVGTASVFGPPSDYVDADTVVGMARITSTDVHAVHGNTYTDTDLVLGTGVISADESAAYADEATVTGLAIVSSNYADADTVISQGIIFASDLLNAGFFDSDRVISEAAISADESAAYADAATVTGLAIVASSYSDATTVIGSAVVSALDASTSGHTDYSDSAAITGAAVISALEGAGYLDSATVTSIGAIASADRATHADSSTTLGVAVISTTDRAAYTDATVLVAVAVISSIDVPGFIDANQAIGLAVITSVESTAFRDSDAVIGMAVITAPDIVPDGMGGGSV